jgi:hydroxymethylglutaryl-CoA synthase
MPHLTRERPPTGISSIGLAFPTLALPLGELARLRGVDPAKYTFGLGCDEMALCSPGTGVVDLAETAARRALARWNGDLSHIGLIAVGTESALDMSRPLSAWVADRLGIRGAVRSYEVKHACYGGTLALRQALEWRLAGSSPDHRAALVIATDIALYAPKDPGEPTQGAGAVAMVIEEPSIASIDPLSFPWSEPAFDFWRPVGEDFPRVDGQFSLDCYKRATENCFRAWAGERQPQAAFAELSAVCFHVPFPKMVKKAVLHMGECLGLTEAETAVLFTDKVSPQMGWNRRCGNAYTASLWISTAQALAGRTEGEQLAAFSYGSGFGAELLTLTAGPKAMESAWVEDVNTDFDRREVIDGARYEEIRSAVVRVRETA